MTLPPHTCSVVGVSKYVSEARFVVAPIFATFFFLLSKKGKKSYKVVEVVILKYWAGF